MNEEKIKYKRKLIVEKPIVIDKKKKSPLKTFLILIIFICLICFLIYFLESEKITDFLEFI